MKDKWKNRETPSIDHLVDGLGESQLSQVIVGHLVIESVIVQLIDLRLTTPSEFDTFRLSFPQKIELCLALGLVDQPLASFLETFNGVRNKFAHRLGHKLSLDEAFDLVNRAAQVGIDFSDDGIHLDKKWCAENYGVEGVLQEVVSNTAQRLAWLIEEQGGAYLFT